MPPPPPKSRTASTPGTPRRTSAPASAPRRRTAPTPTAQAALNEDATPFAPHKLNGHGAVADSLLATNGNDVDDDASHAGGDHAGAVGALLTLTADAGAGQADQDPPDDHDDDHGCDHDDDDHEVMVDAINQATAELIPDVPRKAKIGSEPSERTAALRSKRMGS